MFRTPCRNGLAASLRVLDPGLDGALVVSEWSEAERVEHSPRQKRCLNKHCQSKVVTAASRDHRSRRHDSRHRPVAAESDAGAWSGASRAAIAASRRGSESRAGSPPMARRRCRAGAVGVGTRALNCAEGCHGLARHPAHESPVDRSYVSRQKQFARTCSAVRQSSFDQTTVSARAEARADAGYARFRFRLVVAYRFLMVLALPRSVRTL
jgi:hypothetical protein